MKSETGESQSLWMATADVPAGKPLEGPAEADVCVIGAGVAGLSVAYFLARAGKKVIVLDDGPIASGQTRRTSAHLANALDDRYYEIIRERGEEAAKLAADSHTAAIEAIEAIVRDESIDCDFSRLDGYLFLGGDSTEKEMDRELEASHKAGLTRVEKVAEPAIMGFRPGVSLRFPAQGQFHVLKDVTGLVRAIEKLGGKVYTDTHSRRPSRARPRRCMRRAGRSSRSRRSSSRRTRRSTTRPSTPT
jgi:glycine/D-amino acid oxidase-like deaminating enzyme